MASRTRNPDPESLPERAARTSSERTLPFELRTHEFAGYRVEHIISTGPMGAVLTARQNNREGLVVIKLLHPQLRDDPLSTARISQEAHVLTRVAGKHVVRLLDAGWTALVGPYLVLEHLEGMDLARRLEARGPLPPALAVEYLLQACAGLTVAHAAGITHRDVKPENLFAVAGAQAPLLKLLDFGIAQHSPESFPYREIAPANDPRGPLLGTPAYMAPERILELPNTDQRSDIWSLGVVLHELVTGRSLFERADVAETCARIVNHRFELEANRSVLPLALRGVIARCLARRMVDRFESVEDLAAALRKATLTPERSRGFLTGKYRLQARPSGSDRLSGSERFSGLDGVSESDGAASPAAKRAAGSVVATRSDTLRAVTSRAVTSRRVASTSRRVASPLARRSWLRWQFSRTPAWVWLAMVALLGLASLYLFRFLGLD